MDCAKTSNRIYKPFHHGLAQPFLVFPRETVTPSNAGGVGRNRDSERISGSIACCEARSTIGAKYTRPRPTSKLTTLVAAGKRCGLLTAGKGDNVYVKKPQRYAEFNTTSVNNLIVKAVVNLKPM